ncbi:hypothetical protein [Actinoplanes flavus]|uniref:Uncharacterized protein n=1 Tax=Actinoplanes flavus TaxID=2820290 RepID=A0ABS3UIS2_9ACTN|nr:hypothetical protein [Actinoplanes flavus]MBO3738106.1 hypothetical protein [Actinoplanes flavus]
MRLARISLAPRNGAPATVDAVVLVDATWAAARAGDEVEHVVARAVPEGFEVGVFLQAADGPAGRATADALMRRVLGNSPMLRQWRIVAGSDVPLDSLRH